MPTIKEIALASGVSTATVSYVLNNGPRPVNAETRERVLRVMREMNYHPSAVARGLMNKRMNTVGVVFAYTQSSVITNPYFAPILDGILDAAAAAHQNCMLFTGHVWSNVERSLPIYLDGRCDGLLLIAPVAASNMVAALLSAQAPLVLIGSKRAELNVSSVHVDNVAAARQAVSLLLQKGHRRITMLMDKGEYSDLSDRLLGYRQALADYEIAFQETLLVYGPLWEESGYERTCALMALPASERPTALFCGNDLLALGALRALREQQIQVPADVSVIGFDDIPASLTSSPPLTTVHQPLRQMGERGLALLLDLLDTRPSAPLVEILPTQLVARETVGTAPAP